MEEPTPKRFTLTENRRKILVAIAQAPRKIRSFSHGEVTFQMHPDVIQGWLDDMVGHGLVYCAESTYHITVKGRQKLDNGKEEEYRTAGLRNFQVAGLYQGEHGQYIRPGSDHAHLKSKGQSC